MFSANMLMILTIIPAKRKQ